MKAKDKRKLFGQHLLNNEDTILSIVEEFFKHLDEDKKIDQIIEIGPGKGALTYSVIKELEKRSHHQLPFLVIEKDYEFIEHWKNEETQINFQVIGNDFLNLKQEDYLSQQSSAIISNLPYSVGTRILTELSYFPNKIPFMLVMLQKEVAQRIYAKTSTKNFGSLSLWMQNHWSVERFLHVPPSHFNPPPKIDSEVILLKRRNAPLLQNSYANIENLNVLERMLKNAFSQKRKMIRGAFKADPMLLNALLQTQIDSTRRAETLNFNEWNELYQKYLVSALNNKNSLLDN